MNQTMRPINEVPLSRGASAPRLVFSDPIRSALRYYDIFLYDSIVNLKDSCLLFSIGHYKRVVQALYLSVVAFKMAAIVAAAIPMAVIDNSKTRGCTEDDYSAMTWRNLGANGELT